MHFVRQVADAEAEYNDHHGANDVHLAAVRFLALAGGGAACRLGTAAG